MERPWKLFLNMYIWDLQYLEMEKGWGKKEETCCDNAQTIKDEILVEG